MNILTVFAHPDDAELWAGGTLIKHAAAGDSITIVTFANADSPRKREAEAGARRMGAECYIAKREMLRTSEELTVCIGEVLLASAPSIVITHWEHDCHFEHAVVYKAVTQSVTRTAIDHHLPAMLLSCDTYGSLGITGSFDPTLYIDVSSEFEAKLAALKEHRSQPIERWARMATALGTLHGLRCGCSYAEAFLEVPILGMKHCCTLLPNVVRNI
jgi:LmbE family N-acetylglucosaminyl deacetylase